MSQKYEPIFKKYNKSNITFVAPTTPKDRIKTLVENSSKFIYMVAYAGITGSGREEDLSQIIENIREYSQTPLYIGFGIDEKTCKEKSKNLDGVIVGSAFVKQFASLAPEQAVVETVNKVKELRAALDELV